MAKIDTGATARTCYHYTGLSRLVFESVPDPKTGDVQSFTVESDDLIFEEAIPAWALARVAAHPDVVTRKPRGA